MSKSVKLILNIIFFFETPRNSLVRNTIHACFRHRDLYIIRKVHKIGIFFCFEMLFDQVGNYTFVKHIFKDITKMYDLN